MEETKTMYAIENDVNEKVFIGYAKNLKDCWKNHKKSAKNNNTKLALAMRDIGIEHFSIRALCIVPVSEAKGLKEKLIAEHNAYENGYNSLSGVKSGDSILTKRHLLELVQKGYGLDRIARELGIQWDYIQRQAKKWNIPLSLSPYLSDYRMTRYGKGTVPIIQLDENYSNPVIWNSIQDFVRYRFPEKAENNTARSRVYQEVKMACACWSKAYGLRFFFLTEVSHERMIFRSPYDLNEYTENRDSCALGKMKANGNTVYYVAGQGDIARQIEMKQRSVSRTICPECGGKKHRDSATCAECAREIDF